MKSWIRIVLPSEIYILAACACYLSITVGISMIEMARGINPQFGRVNVAGLIVLVASALFYGFQRVRNFHPACQAEYRNWLRFTPWRAGLPLPLGPVHLIVQDLLIVGLLTGVSSLHKEFEWYLIPSAFLVGYLVTMMFPLILTRKYVPAYLISVGLGGTLYLHDSPLGLSILFAVLYAIAWAGQRDSLREIEFWDLSYFDERIAPFFNPQGFQEVVRSQILGWPFDRLIPHRNLFAIHWKFALALAFLAGWWWFVVIDVTIAFGGSHMMGFGIPVAGILSISRIYTYCLGYAPPLSFSARIVKLRWIIPGYDVVFLAPVLMIAWVIATIWVQSNGNLSLGLAAPVQVAGLILINCFCPPSLDSWRLTGNHRIIPATSQHIGELQETK